MHQLAMDIAHKITKCLGIEGDVCIRWPMQFRINKYSFTEESVGSLGVQLHTDSTFLTILQEDESVGGLEVMNNNGGFIPVQPNPGSLLVNLGDIAKVAFHLITILLITLIGGIFVCIEYMGIDYIGFTIK